VDAFAFLPFSAGLSTAAALIVAIGAQNAFVLRQGLRREHIGAVVAVCVLSDLVLTQVGVRGLGAALAVRPDWQLAARLGGAVFLVLYGAGALRRAWSPGVLLVDGTGSPRATPLAATIAATLAMTWLNPHVYLDTVVLLGAAAARWPTEGRAAFGLGAVTASLVWFPLLGYGASRLAPVFARPAAWRVLDAAVGATMLALAIGLLVPITR
jgi:L-lysine exporter family protein LysE/ArgO